MNVKPTHGDLFPVNIQIKDPIWPGRNLFDFTFSVKPDEPTTLWLDTRDRILPNGKSLYLTIAGAGADFGPNILEGTRLRLIFKNYEEARAEHENDRFNQLKDNYGNLVEEYPNKKKLKMYDRFNRDITDLLRVNPNHMPGRYYWSNNNPEQGWPSFTQPEPPRGIPLWAFLQIENLKLFKQFVMWWIDERQIENGEFGGGLSDDGDMTNQWPGLALMGVEPEKVTDSILREMEAFYENRMFTNGLPTIMTDELHVYEEGINVLPQAMMLDYGDPKAVERLMKTAKAFDFITGINQLGHRQIRSSFFSGTKIAEEYPWAVSKTNYSHLILHPGLALVEFNGNPTTKKMLLEIADGLLAQRRKDDNGNYYIPAYVDFPSGKGHGGRALGSSCHLFWAAWRWTENDKYLFPIMDEINRGNFGILNTLNANLIDLLGKRESWGKNIASRTSPQSGGDFYRHIAWQITGNKQFLEGCYANQIQYASQRMYMMTEGHWWDDRVTVNSKELQRARLGGVALWRSTLYPGHVVSWKFKEPATGESTAILVREATTRHIKIIVFNIENEPVTAYMTAWDIDPGTWEVKTGIDTDGDDLPEQSLQKRRIKLERTGNIELFLQPRKTTIIELTQKKKARPYWKRPDPAIGRDDISISGNSVTVTVHNIGSVDAPALTIALVDKDGKTLTRTKVPAIKAPVDLIPKTTRVKLTPAVRTNLHGAKVVIDPDNKLIEVTERNNQVIIP